MGFYSFFIFFLICIAFQNVIPLHLLTGRWFINNTFAMFIAGVISNINRHR